MRSKKQVISSSGPNTLSSITCKCPLRGKFVLKSQVGNHLWDRASPEVATSPVTSNTASTRRSRARWKEAMRTPPVTKVENSYPLVPAHNTVSWGTWLGLTGRFEKSFRIHIVNKVHWGYSLCFIHLLCSFLDLAVLLVFGEVATSGEALSHKCSPTCGLKQTCPVRDISRLYWTRCWVQSWT